MFIQPDFSKKPEDLIKSKKNKQFLRMFMSNGMIPEKITEILIKTFSFKVLLREIFDHADNPEAIEMRAWRKTVVKQYEKAIRCLEKIYIDDSIPFSKRDTVIKKDIEALRNKKDYFAMAYMMKTSKKPRLVSCQQMLNIQSRVLYEYLRKINKWETDMKIYDFIAEMFRNLYKGTVLSDGLKGLTGAILKRNFIDNTYKFSEEKNLELEKKIKSLIS